MGVPTSEVGYTSVTTGRGDQEVHKGHVVALGEKQLHTLLVLHFNRLTTEYSETTAHFNGNFDTDNQFCVP
jgi:hypothetical protein